MAQIEIEMFKLRAELSDETFLQLNDVYQEWSYLDRLGLMRRTLARFDDLWMVETWWSITPAPSLDRSDPQVATWEGARNPDTYRRMEFTTVG